MDVFTSKAWLLDGPIDSLPGILNYDGQMLRYLILTQGTYAQGKFTTLLAHHGKSDADLPLELFSVNRDELADFKIPWYYFNGGANLLINNHAYRFSFVRPQNTVEPSHYSQFLMSWVGGEGQEEVDIPEARNAGKQWKKILAR